MTGLRGARPIRANAAVDRSPLIVAARATHAPLVTVTAPAGYGKSTLLASWASIEDRTVARVNLDEAAKDPARFVQAVAEACATFSSAVADALPFLSGTGADTLARSAPRLVAALAGTTTPFALFLDDLHVAYSPGCQDVLELVSAGIPAGSTLVTAGRCHQAHLGRIRVDRDVFDIGPDDLRFDGEAAGAVIGHLGLTLDASDLAELVARCEGWPAGIVLSAHVIRAGGDASTIRGDDRYVADYLHREILARIDDDARDFLHRTAVADRLNASLCDSILGTTGSQRMLEHLESSGVLIEVLDRHGEWFRYHALLREYLLGDLHRADPAAITDLHARAARWHRAAGMNERAVMHLLAAGDHEQAAELATETSLALWQSGQGATVGGWIEQLGRDFVESHPWMLVIATWKSLLLGEVIDAERWAAALRRFGDERIPEADREAFESARAMVRAAMLTEGPDRGLSDASLAVASEPEWSPWRDQALHLLGSMLLLAGRVEEADGVFAQAIEAAERQGNADTVILSEPERALIALQSARWDAAAAHSLAGVRAIDEAHLEGAASTVLALAVRARVVLRAGGREEAERLCARAMRARVTCTYLLPFLAVKSRLQLAKLHLALADRRAAMHLLSEVDQITARRADLGALHDAVARFRAHLESTPDSGGSVPLTPAEHRLLPYLQTHLTIGEIGERLFVSRNTVSSEVGSIYRKLGVTARSGAVARATDLGLLGI